jgi:hypothetical protein
VNGKVDSDINEASGLAGDEYDGIFKDFANKVLAMVHDLARTTTKYTTVQILKHARAVTTSKVSGLRCNKMSTWNLAMGKGEVISFCRSTQTQGRVWV